MPNCDFYALDEDSVDVLRFVFSQLHWCLYELASRPDTELRIFDSVDGVLDAFDLSTSSPHFQLYVPAMGGAVHSRRIDFRPGAVPNATFRHVAEGWGLIQLYFEAPSGGLLRASHTNHNSETRARTWASVRTDADDRVDAWNWTEVSRVSSRLNRYIRSRAVASSGSRPILARAQSALLDGVVRLAS